MKYLDEESSKALQENERLDARARKLMADWKIAAEGKFDAEYNATKPLFDEAIEAHKAWQNHLWTNSYKWLAHRSS